jgi:hypothetical protein
MGSIGFTRLTECFMAQKRLRTLLYKDWTVYSTTCTDTSEDSYLEEKQDLELYVLI